jgi:hypothetical protein
MPRRSARVLALRHQAIGRLFGGHRPWRHLAARGARDTQGYGDAMSDQRAAMGGSDNEVPLLPIGGRLNAVKHGLTAKTRVLPGEDPAALQALIDGFKANAQAKNLIEESLLEMAARCFWRAGRAERLEVNRRTIDIVRRAETDAARAAQEVAALGSRLFFDRRGPWQLWPWRDYYHNPPRKSAARDAEDPDGPRKVVDQLEATREGVNWLLREWYEIRKPLEAQTS